jgi:hypothetical protein
MTDIVREVEIVSLPLRFAMIADRAEVALTRLKQGGTLQPRDRKALERAREFLHQAQNGEKLLTSTTMQGYSPAAISAYELSEDASKEASITAPDFREQFNVTKLDSLLSQTPLETSAVDVLCKFFHALAEWCLAQDVAEVEGVQMGSPSYVPS